MKRTAFRTVMTMTVVLASSVLGGCDLSIEGAPPDDPVQSTTITESVNLPPCVAGAGCKVDLQHCTEAQKASAWQGQPLLVGTFQLAFYTSHKNWVCQTPIPQAWPVVPEPGWWCGTVVEQCTCSPSDGCF